MTPVTSNDTLCDNPLWDLRIRWQLQWHPVWRQPGLGSANPHPYTHKKITPPTTPCHGAQRHPVTVSNYTLCDSPVFDLRTRTPTHTRRHLQRHPVWQPPPPTNPQNLRTLTPQLEVRTPIVLKLFGEKHVVVRQRIVLSGDWMPHFWSVVGYISTRNSEPAHCHHIYRILRIYRIDLRKKIPPKIPAFQNQGSPSHLCRSAIRLKNFLKSPPRNWRTRASPGHEWKPRWKNKTSGFAIT